MQVLKALFPQFKRLAVFGCLVLLFASLGTFTSCSTKKNTFTRRAYHQTTAHYNGYFNALEIMKASEQKIVSNHKEDYTEILPLFLYGDESMSKSLYPDMDIVIKKCSKVISRHSMFIKGVEYNKWMDDAYLLVAKAYFYKKEYGDAQETFEFIARNFKNSPLRLNALLWMARIRQETNEKNKLLITLDMIDQEKKLDPAVKGQFYAIYAQHYINVKDYEKAKERLEAAIPLTKNKKQRTRYTYVLAQLYQRDGDFKNATLYYTNVIRLKPKYEMEFQARINRAMAFDLDGIGSVDIKRELNRMLRDKKNKEYRDQIYFALGEIAFREKEEEKGIDYFQKASASSLGNKKLLARIYLRLANYYFAKPNYVSAQAYYDSTLQQIDDSHPEYYTIDDRNKSLKNLVTQLKIIEHEDSLQKVASMSEKEREKIIAILIEKARDEEAKKKKALENDIVNDYNQNQQQAQNNMNDAGKWYFYNPTTRGFGFSDFKKRWGPRPLEDNWRRSNKASAGILDDDGNLVVKQDTIKESDDNPTFSQEFYLKDLPLTDSALIASHVRIIEALYIVGGIYKENFSDFPRSITAFERLAENYDTSKHIASTYYQLFRLHQEMKNKPKAEYYKNLILEKFPYSDYANLVNDPNYMKTTRENQKRVENYYDVVYDFYKRRDYQTVITRCQKSREIFGAHHIENKFDFLKTMSIGYTMPKDTFKLALENFIQRYPDKEEKPLAEKILANLNNILIQEQANDANGKNDGNVVEEAPEYVFDKEKEHYFFMLVPTDNDMNKAKIELSNFNSAFFSLKKLLVNSMLLNDAYQLITIKTFKQMSDATDYYKTVMLNDKELKDIKANGYEFFVISSENFALFYKHKNIDAYRTFFMINYAGK